MSVERILTLYSASWMPWLLLGLIVVLFLLVSICPGAVGFGFRSFYSLLERQYVAAGNVFIFPLMLLFSVLTTSLACCLMYYSGGEFAGLNVLKSSALTVAGMIVQRLCTAYAGYVFSFEKEARTWQEQRLYMWFVLSLLMLAVLAVATVVPVRDFAVVSFAVLAVAYMLAVIVKMLRLFVRFSPFAILYIFIYVITIEVLPLAAVVAGAGVVLR